MDAQKLNFSAGKPLYLQLKEKFMDELLSGNFLETGQQLPSFKKLADRYDVSIITVNLALEELKKQGIISTIPSRGTYLTKSHEELEKLRLLAKQKITLGITFLNSYNPSSTFLSEVISGVSEKCRQLHVNIQVFSTPSLAIDEENNPLLTENLKKKYINGIILASRMHFKDIAFLQKEKVPFVWIANEIAEEKVPGPVPDKAKSALLIAEHIHLLGHRRMALIVPNDVRVSVMVNLMRGLSESKGIALEEDAIITDEGDESEVGYQAVRKILPYKPDVIVVEGVETTYGVISALKKEKMSFPKNIKIIATGAAETRFLSSHDITTLQIPVRQMASKAVEMLHAIINKQKCEDKVILPPKFIIRHSCGFNMQPGKEIIVNNLEELKAIHKNNRLPIN